MAWTLGTTATSAYNNTPDTVSFTCSATAKLIVVSVWINGTTARAGGVPTYNGIPLTDSGQAFVFYAGGEGGTSLFYLTDPSTGSAFDLVLPNTNGVFGMMSIACYIPASGKTASAVNSWQATGTTANPSVATTSVAGNLLVGTLGSGYKNVPTAGTNMTIINTHDAGNQTWGDEYDLSAGTNQAVAFVTSADDWGLIAMEFAEADIAVPRRIFITQSGT